MITKNILFCFLLIGGLAAHAQDANGVFRAAGSPENPKVAISWNRYYNYDGITDICKKIAAAHPQLAKLSSIGKSSQGRDMWLLTITDFNKGKADSRKRDGPIGRQSRSACDQKKNKTPETQGTGLLVS